MSLQEIRTFKDIQDAIIARAKLNSSTAVRNDLKEKINTFYQRLGSKKAYRWSGETRPFTLKARYTTGTISVTNGSDTITGTSTAWTEFDHLFSYMKIESEETPFKVIRVDESGQEIVLDSAYTGTTNASASYTMFKYEYGLFPDLMDIRKIYIPGLQRYLLPAGPNELDELRYQYPFRSGVPRRYTINGHNIYIGKTWETFNINTDFWEDDYDVKPRNKNLIIWPAILSEDRIAKIRYTKILEPMGKDDDEPMVPYENRSILVYGPLEEYFLQNRDLNTKREWEQKYEDHLEELESDIETTDDELITVVDRHRNRRFVRSLWQDDYIEDD